MTHNEDNQFMIAVWKKVAIAELKKKDEQMIIEKQKLFLKHKIKYIALPLLFIIAFIYIFFRGQALDQFTILLGGTILSLFALAYENLNYYEHERK